MTIVVEVRFERMKDDGWTPHEAASAAAASGASRLEIFKAIYDHWGPGPFTIAELEQYGSDSYPSPAARAAATVGLAALVLNYPLATSDDVAKFEATTGISRKVEGLARADRADDALQFYERLDSDRLRLQPIEEPEARRMVARVIGEHEGRLRVLDEATGHFDWGWMFHYQSVSHLTTGRPEDRLAGNAPIIIDRYSGALIETGSTDDPTQYASRYARTGWPT